MPQSGTTIKTKHASGKVEELDLFRGTVKVRNDDGKITIDVRVEKKNRPIVIGRGRRTLKLYKELLKRKLGRISNLSQVLMIFQRCRDTEVIESEKIAGGKVTGLRELYARIDKPYAGSTDWLIDLIVYKLYGLADEEIAIVEGREE